MKISDKLKGVLGAVAPTLGTALGGPWGGIAGKFLADALTGGDVSKVPEALELATSDPSVLLQLKQLEADFELKMKELDIDVYKTDAEDRRDARAMATTKGAGPQIILSAAYTLGYFGIFFCLMFGDVTLAAEVGNLVDVLMGVMTAAQIQIMNFWFGSSRGSAQKTEHLHQLSKLK